MFGGNDPFMRMFSDMHSHHMNEMDRMMDSMMSPFGMFRPPMMGMLDGPRPGRGGHVVHRPRDPFEAFGFGGFGNIFSQMERMTDAAMHDPNSVMFTQSTMISMDPSGRPRVVESSMRKSGDVKETRRHVRDGELEEMEIGHAIGDREHVLEKKRDKDGKVRRNQRFVNLDEGEAQDFDREFQTRAERNMRHAYDPLSRATRQIESGRPTYGRSSRSALPSSNRSGAPIVTLPDDEEEDVGPSVPRHSSHGPIIREISDEEAEQSIPKRRKNMFGNMFRANDH